MVSISRPKIVHPCSERDHDLGENILKNPLQFKRSILSDLSAANENTSCAIQTIVKLKGSNCGLTLN